eukprot:GHVN01077511.1.p1 GENE.GHVN01077511.1~~GHVN01077511.1.p1  ORF type:complete len:254 (+),score=28.95 GHVN01077511.1:54-815(+)
MGRKKRRIAEFKPFCFYCDRDFDDDKVLIQHQKAKHFKCSQCNRKLDTAHGLQIHMLHVHKETFSKVPGAMAGRDNPEFIIHGMEGVPQDVINEKQQRAADKEGLSKHLKSAHTVFGMSVMSGMGFIPDGMNLPGAVGLTPSLVNPAAQNQPFASTPFNQFQPFPGTPAAWGGNQTPMAVPLLAPQPVRHSGIAINTQMSQPTPEAPATAPLSQGVTTAPPREPVNSKINLVYSEDVSVEEMVAMQKYGYKAG